MSIIAIFSGIHSGGEEIARQLANQLNYTFVGEDLLEEVTHTHGTSMEKLAQAMSKPAFFNRFTREREKSAVYIKAVLAQRLAEDNLVYHGPATHFIPSDIGHVLKVGIVAESEFRVKRARDRMGLESAQAVQQIEKADADVAAWIEQLFSRSPFDALLYDIKIPVPDTSFADAVALISENIAKNALRPTDQSVHAVLDFILATRVNLALLESRYYYCDVKAVGEKLEVSINRKPSSSGAFPRAIQMLRYELAEKKVREICLGFEGVNEVETLRGFGYRRPSRALLVDDEEEFALTLSQRLKVRDISSDVVLSGEQALTAVEEEVPDVMVLDLMMPGIDGFEVLRRVKREHPEVEVIILTGHGNEKDERRARDLGAFAFLKKPVDINILTKTMKQAQSKHREKEIHGADQ